MDKYLFSVASSLLAEQIITDYEGLHCAPHENKRFGGYFARPIISETFDWNSMGHGWTYDLALTNLYMMLYHNDKATPPEVFYIKEKSDENCNIAL